MRSPLQARDDFASLCVRRACCQQGPQDLEATTSDGRERRREGNHSTAKRKRITLEAGFRISSIKLLLLNDAPRSSATNSASAPRRSCTARRRMRLPSNPPSAAFRAGVSRLCDVPRTSWRWAENLHRQHPSPKRSHGPPSRQAAHGRVIATETPASGHSSTSGPNSRVLLIP